VVFNVESDTVDVINNAGDGLIDASVDDVFSWGPKKWLGGRYWMKPKKVSLMENINVYTFHFEYVFDLFRLLHNCRTNRQ